MKIVKQDLMSRRYKRDTVIRWYKSGSRYRKYGPAVIYGNGEKFWFS